MFARGYYPGGWWERFFESLGIVFVVAGVGIAIWQFYDKPSQLPVPLLLTGIACLLFILVFYAAGILIDLEYLQRIIKGGQDEDEEEVIEDDNLG